MDLIKKIKEVCNTGRKAFVPVVVATAVGLASLGLGCGSKNSYQEGEVTDIKYSIVRDYRSILGDGLKTLVWMDLPDGRHVYIEDGQGSDSTFGNLSDSDGDEITIKTRVWYNTLVRYRSGFGKEHRRNFKDVLTCPDPTLKQRILDASPETDTIVAGTRLTDKIITLDDGRVVQLHVPDTIFLINPIQNPVLDSITQDVQKKYDEVLGD